MENGEQIANNNGLVNNNKDMTRVSTVTDQLSDTLLRDQMALHHQIEALYKELQALNECNTILKRENQLLRDQRNRAKLELDSSQVVLEKNKDKKDLLIKLAQIILREIKPINDPQIAIERSTKNCTKLLNNCAEIQLSNAKPSQTIESVANESNTCDKTLVTTNGHIDDTESLPSSDLVDTRITLNPPKVARNKQIAVYVAYVENPSNVWVQLKYNKVQNFIHKIRVTQANALKLGNHSLSCSDFYIGMYCVALYSVDNDWYRAQVIAIDRDNAANGHRNELFEKVRVRYIDWGNEADVHISNVTKLSHHLTKRKQAVKCYLQGLTPESKKWSQQVVSQFKRIVCGDTQLCAVFSKPENESNGDVIYPIDLFKVSAGDKLENVLQLLSPHIVE